MSRLYLPGGLEVDQRQQGSTTLHLFHGFCACWVYRRRRYDKVGWNPHTPTLQVIPASCNCSC